jgi:CubicO group peptidase (beta-lactamase class C family)
MEVGERIEGADRVWVERAGDVRVLEPSGRDPREVGDLVVRTPDGGVATVEEILRRHRVRSAVVLHRGQLAHEWFAPGAASTDRHLCYSITKSFTGLLAAVAVRDGRLDRSARVADLIPELASSGFADATVGHAADMTVAIDYDEDYLDAGQPPSGGESLGFADYMIALGLVPPDGLEGSQAPRSIRDFVAAVGPGRGRHGEAFAYATPVTDVLGWLLELAHDGPSYADLLGAGIWSHIGAEHDAMLMLDPAGTPVSGGGLVITTADMARFGLFVSEQARTGADGIVPGDVIDAIRGGGDLDVFQQGGGYGYLPGYSYRDQWWLPGDAGRPMLGWGIHGQLLWIDPDAELVVACHSAGEDADDERRELEFHAMCRALAGASSGWA